MHLDNFAGPFDLLLGLITKHKLDITEIALATVTDEFIAHIRPSRPSPSDWDLRQATEFLLVAATLLDLKAARLLPQSGPEDEEDLALIEARDLLFARLLQYRAFKDIAAHLRRADGDRGPDAAAHGIPRAAARRAAARAADDGDPRAARADRGPGDGAQAGARPSGWTTCTRPRSACASRPPSSVDRLRRERVASFRSLVADADSTLVIVARFLALLELFRESAIAFEQAEALGELTVRWTGPEDGDIEVDDEFDEPPPAAGADDHATRAADDASRARTPGEHR